MLFTNLLNGNMSVQIIFQISDDQIEKLYVGISFFFYGYRRYGKDSIYAASLFAEMISVTGMSPSELIDSLESSYGHYVMEEDNLTFAPEEKESIVKHIMDERKLPEFEMPIERVGYEDGCKVYFCDGSFVSCRFSGTEPLLRIFAESEQQDKATKYIEVFKQFIKVV